MAKQIQYSDFLSPTLLQDVRNQMKVMGDVIISELNRVKAEVNSIKITPNIVSSENLKDQSNVTSQIETKKKQLIELTALEKEYNRIKQVNEKLDAKIATIV
jgi:hypothetical protein